jgi:hypothetical protein
MSPPRRCCGAAAVGLSLDLGAGVPVAPTLLQMGGDDTTGDHGVIVLLAVGGEQDLLLTLGGHGLFLCDRDGVPWRTISYYILYSYSYYYFVTFFLLFLLFLSFIYFLYLYTYIILYLLIYLTKS